MQSDSAQSLERCSFRRLVFNECLSYSMLDDFGHEMDNTQSRLDNVMKKLAKVSHMTSGNLPLNTQCHSMVLLDLYLKND